MVILRWCLGLVLFFSFLPDLWAQLYTCNYTLKKSGEVDEIRFVSSSKHKKGTHYFVLADQPYYADARNGFAHEFYSLKYSGLFTRLTGSLHDYWYIINNYTAFVMLTSENTVDSVGVVRWQEPIGADNPVESCFLINRN